MADNIHTHEQDPQATDDAARQAEDTGRQAEQQAQGAAGADQGTAQADDAATKADAAKEADAEAGEDGAGAAEAEGEAQEAGQAEQADKAREAPAPDADALQARVIEAELRAAAAVAGVPANKLAYVTRLADRSQAGGADPAKYAAAQIKQILTDFPELAQQPAGTGGAGNHARNPEQGKDPFLKGMDA